jgi:hypothetical protein
MFKFFGVKSDKNIKVQKKFLERFKKFGKICQIFKIKTSNLSHAIFWKLVQFYFFHRGQARAGGVFTVLLHLWFCKFLNKTFLELKLRSFLMKGSTLRFSINDVTALGGGVLRLFWRLFTSHFKLSGFGSPCLLVFYDSEMH